MTSPFSAFAKGFLIFFGVFILYFNFCLVLNITPFPGFLIPNYYNHWNSDYYFGFSSIVTAINNFPQVFGLQNMQSNLETFMDSIGGWATTFRQMDAFINSGNIVNLLFAIGNVILAPLTSLIALIKIIVTILASIIQLFIYVTQIVSGNYNLPVWGSGLDETTGVITLIPTNTGVTW